MEITLRRNLTWASLALLVLAVGLLAACSSSGSLDNNPTLAPTITSLEAAHTSTPSPAHSSARPTRTPTSAGAEDGFPTIRVDQLPPEARTTLKLIAQGGPFPYRQDGVVFQNREGYLPAKPNGYYHEYTVKTPGSSDRGARRIITGASGEMYYTDDHYVTFKRIVQ